MCIIYIGHVNKLVIIKSYIGLFKNNWIKLHINKNKHPILL